MNFDEQLKKQILEQAYTDYLRQRCTFYAEGLAQTTAAQERSKLERNYSAIINEYCLTDPIFKRLLYKQEEMFRQLPPMK